MKLSHLAVAAAVALAAALPSASRAAIANDSWAEVGGDLAETFIVVFDEHRSYVMDTGIIRSQLRDYASTVGTHTIELGPMFETYRSLDIDLFDGTATSGTRWLLANVSTFPSGLIRPSYPGSATAIATLQVNASTATATSVVTRPGAQALEDIVGNLAAIDGQGTHTRAIAVNGESISTPDSWAYWSHWADEAFGVPFSNTVGQTARLWNIGNEGAATAAFDSVVTFDGSMLTIQTAAVPEPEGLALLATGALVAFGARRRARRG